MKTRLVSRLMPRTTLLATLHSSEAEILTLVLLRIHKEMKVDIYTKFKITL
jgi:hypothetical protein